MEEKLKLLEKELQDTRREMGEILLDIRAYIMEFQNPLRPYDKPKDPETVQEPARENTSEMKGENDDSRKAG